VPASSPGTSSPTSRSSAPTTSPSPLLDHGRVKAAKVPQGTDAFTAPVAAAKRAATTIVYI
jgi:hypothetical protein